MAWTLTAVRAALAVRLDTIPDLNALDTMPAAISPPTAAVTPAGGDFVQYDESFDGAARLSLIVTLWVAKVDEPSAQQALDAYIVPTGTYSIRAAITSGGTVDWEWATVGAARDYGKYEFGTGPSAIDYLGCVFPVSVGVS
jgi:hypothetical protein